MRIHTKLRQIKKIIRLTYLTDIRKFTIICEVLS